MLGKFFYLFHSEIILKSAPMPKHKSKTNMAVISQRRIILTLLFLGRRIRARNNERQVDETPEERLCVTLHYLSTGDTKKTID